MVDTSKWAELNYRVISKSDTYYITVYLLLGLTFVAIRDPRFPAQKTQWSLAYVPVHRRAGLSLPDANPTLSVSYTRNKRECDAE